MTSSAWTSLSRTWRTCWPGRSPSYDIDVLRLVDRDVHFFLNGPDSQVLDTSAQTPDPSRPS